MRAFALLVAGAVVLVLAGAAGAVGGSSTPRQAYVTDGGVDAIVDTGSVTYIGGSFTRVGPRTGPAVALSASTGDVVAGDQVSGASNTVYAVASDGSGGYFVGGDFSHVGGLVRHNLAHILPNGTVDPTFDPEPNGDVMAIAVSGSTVYVGGQFLSIGGQSRGRVAALDFAGTPSSFNPVANATVRALAVSGGNVYVGGDFSSIGGQSRSAVARVPTSSSAADPLWDPHASGSVYSIVVSGSEIYLGGAFTLINQPFVTANRVAAVDATTGAVVPGFVPGGANNSVYTLALSDGTLYLGGIFSSMDGSQRRGAAAIDAETGTIETWNPDPQFAVAALAVSGTTLYAGGSFSFMNGTARNGLAAFDTSTGNLTSWDPDAGNEVLALDVSGSTVFAGGIFSSVNMEPRSNIAAIDDSTGVATSWNPDSDGTILALGVSGQNVFAGGVYNNIGGQARHSIAALDAVTGAADVSWNAGMPTGEVNALAVSGSNVYIGGQFTTVDGQTRNNLAELDSTGAPVIGWNPNVNDIVSSLALFGSTLYVGGAFSQVSGTTRNHIAAVDASTGALTSWDPNANNSVATVAGSASAIYIGGDFTQVGGQTRDALAAVDPTTGVPTAWDPSPDAVVQAIAENGPFVFVGGQFGSIGGQDRSYLAALDATTGNATSFDPEPNNPVEAITGVGNTLDVGGVFTGFELGANQGYASFGLAPPDTLTVGRAGAGSGTVSSSPAGISCGTTCSSAFDDGSTVTLTATAAAGSTFAGWSGGGCSGTGTCDVTLAGDTTVVATFASGTFSPPTVTGFNPASGGTHATVTVTGTNFTGTTGVKLGGVSAAFTVVDATHLTFTVPTGAPPSGQIAVTNPGGTGTSSGSFSVTPPPSIASLNPTSGPVGTSVTITGTNLGGTVAVQIGVLITVPTSVSATQVVFTVPPGAVTGLVRVLGPGGSATSPGVFTVS